MRWGIFGVVGGGWGIMLGSCEWLGKYFWVDRSGWEKFFWVGEGGWGVSALFNNGQIKHWTEAIFEQMQDLIQCQQ